MNDFMELYRSLAFTRRSIFPENREYKPRLLIATFSSIILMLGFGYLGGNTPVVTPILSVLFAIVIGFAVRFIGMGAHFIFGILAVAATLGTIVLGDIFFNLIVLSRKADVTVSEVFSVINMGDLVLEILESTTIAHYFCYILSIPISWKLSFYEPNDAIYESRLDSSMFEDDFDDIRGEEIVEF